MKERYSYSRGMGSVLPDTGNSSLNKLIRDNADVFSTTGKPGGLCLHSPMTIDTTGPPIGQPAYTQT